jgi:hypothetical protein
MNGRPARFQCGWAKAYSGELRVHGKKHHTAVRALAFKWMRILYRCWKVRQPYREEVYLASLAKQPRLDAAPGEVCTMP